MSGTHPIVQQKEAELLEAWKRKFGREFKYGERPKSKPTELKTVKSSSSSSSSSFSSSSSSSSSSSAAATTALFRSRVVNSSSSPDRVASPDSSTSPSPAPSDTAAPSTSAARAARPVSSSSSSLIPSAAFCDDCGSRLESLLSQCNFCGFDPLSDSDEDNEVSKRRRKKRAAKLNALLHPEAGAHKRAKVNEVISALAKTMTPW